MNTICVGSLTNKTAAFQVADSGVNPTPTLQNLIFSRSSCREVSDFIKQHHYTHSHAHFHVIDYAFAVHVDRRLCGACLFGAMGGNPKAMCVAKESNRPSDYRELMRLVLLDELPKNSETRFVAWCLRWLRTNTELFGIVSFADPSAGHVGTIYKAGNWHCLGFQKSRRPDLCVDGENLHPRLCFNRYRTSSVPKLQALGHTVELISRPVKYKFVYLLRSGLSLKI